MFDNANLLDMLRNRRARRFRSVLGLESAATAVAAFGLRGERRGGQGWEVAPASPITLHGHRRPRLYRDLNLARRRDALSSIILPLNILGVRGQSPR